MLCLTHRDEWSDEDPARGLPCPVCAVIRRHSMAVKGGKMYAVTRRVEKHRSEGGVTYRVVYGWEMRTRRVLT